MSCDITALAHAYMDAKAFITDRGFADEIDWQEDASLKRLTEETFLREAAWVILSSGMREKIVRRKFPLVSRAFFNWRNSVRIVQNAAQCRELCLRAFCHEGKTDAILVVCSHVAECGMGPIVKGLESSPLTFLRRFPYIGPVTACHLAKNVGISCAKEDRHLRRISSATGFQSVHEMCTALAERTSERIEVIDIVLWRYATLNPNYVREFTKAAVG